MNEPILPAAILINGREWSIDHFRNILTEEGLPADLVDCRRPLDMDDLRRRPLVVNRTFASALHKEGVESFRRIDEVMKELESAGTPVLNPPAAHRFDVDKMRTMEALAAGGLQVPRSVVVPAGTASDDPVPADFPFPRILKPNCGGRSALTWKIGNRAEWQEVFPGRPAGTDFIIQQYMQPRSDFITRVEVIGRNIYLLLQRTLASNGLSSYNLGSRYRPYPDCPPAVAEASLEAMKLLSIEFGSLDIIETADGGAFIIDVNAVSNFTEDNVEMFGCDAVGDTARYCRRRYDELTDRS